MITLDGKSHFPKDFLDLKSFNSSKAQAIVDADDDDDTKKLEREKLERIESNVNTAGLLAGNSEVAVSQAY